MARHNVTDESIEKMILKVFDEVQGVVVSGVESLLSNMHGPAGSKAQGVVVECCSPPLASDHSDGSCNVPSSFMKKKK